MAMENLRYAYEKKDITLFNKVLNQKESKIIDVNYLLFFF